MEDILEITFKTAFSWKKKKILIQISLNFVWQGPNENKSALVQLMNWHLTSAKQQVPIHSLN